MRKPYQNITEWKKQQEKKKPSIKLGVVRRERATPGKCSAQWADKNGMVDPRLK